MPTVAITIRINPGRIAPGVRRQKLATAATQTVV
jgi:hypothetical protein